MHWKTIAGDVNISESSILLMGQLKPQSYGTASLDISNTTFKLITGECKKNSSSKSTIIQSSPTHGQDKNKP